MGRDRKKGQTFLNYVVDRKYGDSDGFQAGLDLQAVRARRGPRAGAAHLDQLHSPLQMNIPSNSFPDCDGTYPSTEVHTGTTRPSSRTSTCTRARSCR